MAAESDAEVSQFDSLENCSDGGMSAENFNTLKKVPLAPIDPPPEFQVSQIELNCILLNSFSNSFDFIIDNHRIPRRQRCCVQQHCKVFQRNWPKTSYRRPSPAIIQTPFMTRCQWIHWRQNRLKFYRPNRNAIHTRTTDCRASETITKTMRVKCINANTICIIVPQTTSTILMTFMLVILYLTRISTIFTMCHVMNIRRMRAATRF